MSSIDVLVDARVRVLSVEGASLKRWDVAQGAADTKDPRAVRPRTSGAAVTVRCRSPRKCCALPLTMELMAKSSSLSALRSCVLWWMPSLW